jgi:hypothetical protein
MGLVLDYWIYVLCAVSLSRKHADAQGTSNRDLSRLVYLLFLGLGIVAQRNYIGITELCGSWEPTCKTIHHTLTSFKDEVYLLIAITVLGIGPQLTAYAVGYLGRRAHPHSLGNSNRLFGGASSSFWPF